MELPICSASLGPLVGFNLCLVWNGDCFAVIEEVLLGLPFCEKSNVLWLASFFAVLWGFVLRGIT